jgi:hypothetical protein
MSFANERADRAKGRARPGRAILEIAQRKSKDDVIAGWIDGHRAKMPT